MQFWTDMEEITGVPAGTFARESFPEHEEYEMYAEDDEE